MNESDFENELRALRPAPPTQALAERIADELSSLPLAVASARAGLIVREPDRGGRGWLHAVGWAATGAAAVLAAMVVLNRSSTTGEPEVEPVRAAETVAGGAREAIETSSELIDATAEELLVGDDQEPAQRVRFTYLERHTWTDSETGALIAVEVPREELLLVPVAMQ